MIVGIINKQLKRIFCKPLKEEEIKKLYQAKKIKEAQDDNCDNIHCGSIPFYRRR